MLRLKVGIPLVCFLFTLIFGKFEFCYVKSLILWIRLNPLLDSRLYSVLYCIQYVRTYVRTRTRSIYNNNVKHLHFQALPFHSVDLQQLSMEVVQTPSVFMCHNHQNFLSKLKMMQKHRQVQIRIRVLSRKALK